jgi:hypothetical protein
VGPVPGRELVDDGGRHLVEQVCVVDDEQALTTVAAERRDRVPHVRQVGGGQRGGDPGEDVDEGPERDLAGRLGGPDDAEHGAVVGPGRDLAGEPALPDPRGTTEHDDAALVQRLLGGHEVVVAGRERPPFRHDVTSLQSSLQPQSLHHLRHRW